VGDAARQLQSASGIEAVALRRHDATRLRDVLDGTAWDRLCRAGEESARLLAGRRMWHINSTSTGGGVAELLSWFLPLAAAAGIDVRWLVLTAPTGFFELTKRVHHLLHNSPRRLTREDCRVYERYLSEPAAQVRELVRPGDMVVIHDPQPAGLIPAVAQTGAAVVWRCHVGSDSDGASVRKGREFLRQYVEQASALVFSRKAFVWDGLPADRTHVVQPAIDPRGPKNQPLDEDRVNAILLAVGLRDGVAGTVPTFERGDGSVGRVSAPATVLQTAPVPEFAPIVAQISRWDPLKDPVGVMEGFAEHVDEALGAHLVLAGPAVDAVTDDPESAHVLEDVRRRWHSLPAGVRERVHVAELPMDDSEENAAVVNALQRASTVVVQKSLHEGFGLTVAEALFKGRPVLASRAGGIQDQIVDRVSGILLEDPANRSEFGRQLTDLLRRPDLRVRLGKAAHHRVVEEYFPDRLAAAWVGVIGQALDP
jgi:trehalose synthase